MPNYIFILRKKGIEIELNSPDKEFISRQMAAWQNVFMPDVVITKKSNRQKPAITPPFRKIEIPEDKIPPSIQEPAIPVVEEQDIIAQDFVIDEENISEIEIAQTLAESESLVKELEMEISDVQDVPDAITIPEEEDKSYPEHESIVEEIDEMEEDAEIEPEEEEDLTQEFDEIDIPEDISAFVTSPQVDKEPEVDIEGMEDLDDLLAQFNEESDTEPEEIEEILEEEEIIEEIAEEPSDEDEFEAVISAMASELEDEVEEVVMEEEPEEIEAEYVEELPDDEEDELFAKLNQQTELINAALPETKPEPQIVAPPAPKVSFDNYINSLTMKTPVDLLLATAYYVENFEELAKFTTKDISARTLKVFKRPVSPNTVLTAVNKGYIEVVPDFTGNAESNEYSLTDSGREYVMNELS